MTENDNIIHYHGRATMHDEILQAIKNAVNLPPSQKEVFTELVEKTEV